MGEKSDVDRIQAGAGAKFNSSLSDLQRIHEAVMMANHQSQLRNYDGWLSALQVIDREVGSYLSSEEQKKMDGVRLFNIPPVKGGMKVLIIKKLWKYEELLRYFRAKKKLGIIADDDASTAIMR